MDRKFLLNTLKIGFKKIQFLANLIFKILKFFVKLFKTLLHLLHKKLLRFNFYNWLLKKAKRFFNLRFVKNIFRFIKSYNRFAYGFLIILFIFGGIQLYRANRVGAWWDNSWYYRKPITIAYTGTTELNDFQIKIPGSALTQTTLYTAGKLQGDCSDIRFTDSKGKKLSYWIEETSGSNDLVDCSASNYDVWVKVPKLQTGNTIIYFYYGNKQASSDSNGGNTFDFFDGFSDSSLDTLKWTQVNVSTYSISGGNLLTSANSVDPAKLIAVKAPTSDNYILRSKYKVTGGVHTSERVGLSIKTNVSDGRGYNYLLGYDFTNLNRISFLDDFVAWGISPENSWTKNTWYIFELMHDGTNVRANRDDGTWYTQSWSGRIGYPALNIGSYDAVTSWDYALVRKYASTSPATPTAGTEQTQENYSSSGGKPVVYFPLTSDTCDNSGCINMENPVNGGEPPVLDIDFEEGKISTNQCIDGSVADICDSSGSGNNGTANGTMTDSDFVGGKIGDYALDFDGVDDAVDIVAVNNIDDLPLGDYTVQGWVKYSGTGDFKTLLSNWDNNGSGWFIRIQSSGTTNTIHHSVYYSTTKANYETVDNVIPSGTWTHFSVIWNASSKSSLIYINGQLSLLQAQTPGNGTYKPSTNNSLGIGALIYSTGATQFYDGLIDNIKIYNYARTPEQIKRDYNNTKAYFGSKEKTPQFETINSTAPGDPHVGSTKQYLNFDGTDDYLVVPDNDNLDFGTGAFSLSAWVKSSFANVNGRIIYKYNTDTTRGFMLSFNSSYVVDFQLWDTGGTNQGVALGNTVLNDGKWHHLVGVRNGVTTYIYIDGQLEGLGSGATADVSGGSDLYIGQAISGSHQFQGQIAGVKIFDYALSADEVKAQYNTGIDGSGTGKSIKVGR